MELSNPEPDESIDIRGFGFEQFVKFVFDRDVPADSGNTRSGTWYWAIDVDFDAQPVCEFYVRLFSQPEFLRDKYTTPQLEQAFWAIFSCNLDCSAARIIWDEDLPFANRSGVIRSMYDLFSRLFIVEPLVSAVFMWWDALCYDWHCEIRKRENGGEDKEMQDVMFETLERILSLDSEHCQAAALHGLGHLHHPLTPSVVSKFLITHPDLSEEMKNYALAASTFKVL